MCALIFKSSHRPHGKLTSACCLQGGGVYVYSGTATITSSSIYGNTAGYVRAHMFKSSHCPDGKIADVLASTHFCTTAADALVNYRMYVPQRYLENSPSPPWETHVLLVVYRAAVSMSWEAQWPSHRAPSMETLLTMCALIFNISHRPHGKIADALALILACAPLQPTIRSTIQGVRAAETLENFPSRPDGKIADLLDLTHTCTTANDASVNYSMYVPQ